MIELAPAGCAHRRTAAASPAAQQGSARSPRARGPRWTAFVGLLITLLLVLSGIFLIRDLTRAGRLQDCVMSGRTNCAPIDPASAR